MWWYIGKLLTLVITVPNRLKSAMGLGAPTPVQP